ncbi:exocyst complex component 3-like protein 2 isoform 1-T3 [Clarias gariepinus]|uniref:tumor necrosis factor alpha-induced protein 2 n=1 Tax=Clarias gariepinus TaxID=13013 RepID=UPI00234DD744|nr:tumor necrosis factor alpha-induced protein 2 [Clarias gariepinus]XP_053363399.1 tumor necrosis factor alpha-induced protein 2 [Clarias gariepinus]XP_053363400.1 tumor necrosis factor alpha-induced protein 2 [Clarias gariepinus]
MPILKNLPARLKGGRGTLELENTHSELILRKMSLNHNPFAENGLDEEWPKHNGGSLLDGGAPRDRNPFEDEEDENEANEVRRGGSGKGGSFRGTLDRIKGVSPLKTLGKLGKGLRMSSRSKGTATPSPQGSIGMPSPMEKKKKGRRSSEGSLLRMAGRCRENLRKESLPNGDLCSESDADSTSRRLSLLKIVGRGKKRESLVDRSASPAPEEEPVEEEPVVKPREPLSVLEILQLVNKRDLLLADTHILELEQECKEASTPPPGGVEDLTSPSSKDSSRRKAKDVELLYEALQKELWDVVRESLRSPTAGPNLGLVVQVLQQEEQADQDWIASEGAVSGGPRPRELKKRWKEAVAEAANENLPKSEVVLAGELAVYLDKLRVRMVEDLGAARRNVVSVYPEDYDAFHVYVNSYHQAITCRLQTIANGDLQITDIYSLLDWLYNKYDRDVIGTVSITSPINRSQLSTLLPAEVVDKLELDCLNYVRGKVTNELSQVLDEEEKRWIETLHVEEYQIPLANAVIQRLQGDLEKSAAINRGLASRVAQCSLNGLADFLYSFQRKVEMFHEGLVSAFGENEDGYVAKTIGLANCCPPFRSFVERCVNSDPAVSEDSGRRANTSLDKIVNLSVRVLNDRIFEHIRSFFDKLVKRKWLSNTEAFDQIVSLIREHFKKFKRMEGPPYQLLVGEVHRRVMTEYLRAIMRGRIICTSLKMRKRMAGRLREEGKNLKTLFKELESPASWLDSAIPHISEIILMEDTPSIQIEVGVLVREFPDVRKKHVSAILNIRGMTRQIERQEILNIVKDIENSDSLTQLSRDRALFADVPVTSEVHCLNMGLSRIALTASSFLYSLRGRQRRRTPVRENHDDML